MTTKKATTKTDPTGPVYPQDKQTKVDAVAQALAKQRGDMPQDAKDAQAMDKTIFAKLLRARRDFHKIKLVKTGRNMFNDSRYFKLEDFLPHALQCMDSAGLFPLVSYSHEYATMTVYDTVTGETLTIQSPMSSANLKGCHEVQNLGAVETYTRRYLWLTLMEVQEGDPVEEIKAEEEPATAEQIAHLWEYHETEYMTDAQKKWLELANDKITSPQAEKALKALKVVEDNYEAV